MLNFLRWLGDGLKDPHIASRSNLPPKSMGVSPEAEFAVVKTTEGTEGLVGFGLPYDLKLAPFLVEAGYLYSVGHGKHLPTWLGLVVMQPNLFQELTRDN